MRMRFWLFLVLIALLLCGGCIMRKSPAYEESYSYLASDGDFGGAPAPAPPMEAMDYASVSPSSKSVSRPGKSRPSTTASMQPRNAIAEGETSGGDDTTAQAPEAAPARMVHYNGWARIRVARPDETIRQISDLALAAGGNVEQLSTAQVTIRVPVANFQAIFDQLLTLGDVLGKSISAEDITDAYADVELRLQTAKSTRERLQVLLAKAKEEEEKIALIKQIQRLTEEIDLMDSQMRLLSSLASFSRITVQVDPRQSVGDRPVTEDVAGLGWIQSLSPFRRDVSQSGRLNRIDTPEGFVALDKRHHFTAESADGAVIWTSRFLDQPRGDAAFWVDAIKTRIASEFASAEVVTIGDYQFLRLVDASEKPYRYLVGIKVEGRFLRLIEIYYPSADQEERYQEAVRAAIAGRIG